MEKISALLFIFLSLSRIFAEVDYWDDNFDESNVF